MKVIFLSQAKAEMDDAVIWYNEQTPGLGLEFLDEIDHAIHRMIVFPLSCSELASHFRRCLLPRFPYGIIYRIEPDEIIVIAIAHLHRKPNYWAGR